MAAETVEKMAALKEAATTGVWKAAMTVGATPAASLAASLVAATGVWKAARAAKRVATAVVLVVAQGVVTAGAAGAGMTARATRAVAAGATATKGLAAG